MLALSNLPVRCRGMQPTVSTCKSEWWTPQDASRQSVRVKVINWTCNIGKLLASQLVQQPVAGNRPPPQLLAGCRGMPGGDWTVCTIAADLPPQAGPFLPSAPTLNAPDCEGAAWRSSEPRKDGAAAVNRSLFGSPAAGRRQVSSDPWRSQERDRAITGAQLGGRSRCDAPVPPRLKRLVPAVNSPLLPPSPHASVQARSLAEEEASPCQNVECDPFETCVVQVRHLPSVSRRPHHSTWTIQPGPRIPELKLPAATLPSLPQDDAAVCTCGSQVCQEGQVCVDGQVGSWQPGSGSALPTASGELAGVKLSPVSHPLQVGGGIKCVGEGVLNR